MIEDTSRAVLRPVRGKRMVYFLNNVRYDDALMFTILDILLGYKDASFRIPRGSLLITAKVAS
jgi:hypothetical protein